MSSTSGELITLDKDKLIEKCQQVLGSTTNIGLLIVIIIVFVIILCLCFSSVLALFFNR